MEQKKCFVIASIKDEGSHERNKINDLIENYFKLILTDYIVEISHQISTLGRITAQVITKIFQSDLIIADLTDINGNVMYELGVADTLQKPVIIICESKTKLPFDKYDQRTIMYDYVPYAMLKFSNDFKKAVNSVRKINNEIENTVTTSIGTEYLTQNLDFKQITSNATLKLGIDNVKRNKIIRSADKIFQDIKTFDIERYNQSIVNTLTQAESMFNEKIIARDDNIVFGDYTFDYKIVLESKTIYLKVMRTLVMVNWSNEANKINNLKNIFPELHKAESHPILIVPQTSNAGRSRKGISLLKVSLRDYKIVNFDKVKQDINDKRTDANTQHSKWWGK